MRIVLKLLNIISTLPDMSFKMIRTIAGTYWISPAFLLFVGPDSDIISNGTSHILRDIGSSSMIDSVFGK